MAKKKTDETAELDHTPALSLDTVAYALVHKGDSCQFVKFNIDIATKTVSEIEVMHTGHKFDCGDELVITFEDDLYST